MKSLYNELGTWDTPVFLPPWKGRHTQGIEENDGCLPSIYRNTHNTGWKDV